MLVGCRRRTTWFLWYVPLALTLIGPVIVNILLFHVLMNPGGIVPGLIGAISWSMVFYSVRPAFQGIFRDVRTNTGMAKGDEKRREEILAA